MVAKIFLLFLLVLQSGMGQCRAADAPLAVLAEEACALAECYLPDLGKRYDFTVSYPDGDHGTLELVPEKYDGSGTLWCKNRWYSALSNETFESAVQYMYLPDGIYEIESIGSGVPELWLPAELASGSTWQGGDATHTVQGIGVPCPLPLLKNERCLHVVSRYQIMPDVELESYYAENYGKIFSRIRSTSTVELELISVETLSVSGIFRAGKGENDK